MTNSTNFSKPSQISTGFNLAAPTDTSSNLLLQNGDDFLLQDNASFLLFESGFAIKSTNFAKANPNSTNFAKASINSTNFSKATHVSTNYIN